MSNSSSSNTSTKAQQKNGKNVTAVRSIDELLSLSEDALRELALKGATTLLIANLEKRPEAIELPGGWKTHIVAPKQPGSTRYVFILVPNTPETREDWTKGQVSLATAAGLRENEAIAWVNSRVPMKHKVLDKLRHFLRNDTLLKGFKSWRFEKSEATREKMLQDLELTRYDVGTLNTIGELIADIEQAIRPKNKLASQLAGVKTVEQARKEEASAKAVKGKTPKGTKPNPPKNPQAPTPEQAAGAEGQPKKKKKRKKKRSATVVDGVTVRPASDSELAMHNAAAAHGEESDADPQGDAVAETVASSSAIETQPNTPQEIQAAPSVDDEELAYYLHAAVERKDAASSELVGDESDHANNAVVAPNA